MSLDWSLRGVGARIVQTIVDPRTVAAELMTLKQPRPILWAALGLAGVLTALQVSVLAIAQPVPNFTAGPLASAVVFTAFLIAMVFTLFYCGKAMGGVGGFGDTIALIAWFQFTMFALQFVQSLAFVLVPPIGGLLSMLGLILTFHILVNFVNMLHGYGNRLKSFGVVILSFFGVAFGLVIILTFITAATGLGV